MLHHGGVLRYGSASPLQATKASCLSECQAIVFTTFAYRWFLWNSFHVVLLLPPPDFLWPKQKALAVPEWTWLLHTRRSFLRNCAVTRDCVILSSDNFVRSYPDHRGLWSVVPASVWLSCEDRVTITASRTRIIGKKSNKNKSEKTGVRCGHPSFSKAVTFSS